MFNYAENKKTEEKNLTKKNLENYSSKIIYIDNSIHTIAMNLFNSTIDKKINIV